MPQQQVAWFHGVDDACRKRLDAVGILDNAAWLDRLQRMSQEKFCKTFCCLFPGDRLILGEAIAKAKGKADWEFPSNIPNPDPQPPSNPGPRSTGGGFMASEMRVWNLSMRAPDLIMSHPGAVVFSKQFQHFVEAMADAGAHARVSWFPKVVRPFVFELAHYYGYYLKPDTRDEDLRDQVTLC